jgi:hypothetical protein
LVATGLVILFVAAYFGYGHFRKIALITKLTPHVKRASLLVNGAMQNEQPPRALNKQSEKTKVNIDELETNIVEVQVLISDELRSDLSPIVDYLKKTRIFLEEIETRNYRARLLNTKLEDLTFKQWAERTPWFYSVSESRVAGLATELLFLADKIEKIISTDTLLNKELASTIYQDWLKKEQNVKNSTHRNWEVIRTILPRPDKVDCEVRHTIDSKVRMGRERIHVDFERSVEPKEIEIQFDDQPIHARSATVAERGIGTLILKDEEFKKVKGSTRLRISIRIANRIISSHDIDLHGHLEALEALRDSRCM